MPNRMGQGTIPSAVMASASSSCSRQAASTSATSSMATGSTHPGVLCGPLAISASSATPFSWATSAADGSPHSTASRINSSASCGTPTIRLCSLMDCGRSLSGTMVEPALRTHCSSPPVLTMNRTVCSALSLLRMASTATKSSLSGILLFGKSRHVERNKTAESGHALPSFLFLNVQAKIAVLRWPFFRSFFCSPTLLVSVYFSQGQVMLRFPALLAAFHADYRKKLLARHGDLAAGATSARFAGQHRCRRCWRGILRTLRCPKARETRRERCRVRSGNFRLGCQLAERRHGPHGNEAARADADQALQQGDCA